MSGTERVGEIAGKNSMKTYDCSCGNKLFFDSSRCLNCSAEAGMCPVCRCVTNFDDGVANAFRCGRAECGAVIHRCSNFVENSCNRGVLVDEIHTGTTCDYCQLTTIIPDLNVDGNREKWIRLEAAKRRVLAILDELNLPFRPDAVPQGPRLSFEFRADGTSAVQSRHKDGCITINIQEADSVARESARVTFQEPQRTLVGHFRHELGHYYWDLLIRGQNEADFRSIFADERDPDYGTALAAYHNSGPQPNWQTNYISGYATMHPWEDFAESFGAYLDIMTVLQTAQHFNLTSRVPDDAVELIRQYQQVGLVANELNRDMGLVDLVPELFVTPVIQKLQYVHKLVQSSESLIYGELQSN